MAALHIRPRPLHRIILTDMKYGAALALHQHRSKRIRAKYRNAVVFLRGMVTTESLNKLIPSLQRHGVMSVKAWSRLCRIARKCGIDARMVRP